MHPAQQLLTQSLAIGALVAATLNYAILVRNRFAARVSAAQLAEAEHIGLGALVRVLLDESGD